ncbi:MAG: PqiC family protein [Gemmatimonadota bacterium]
MRTTLRLVALVLVATSIGCSVLEPRPDGARYFLLRSIAEAPNGPPLSDVVLGLGPVTVPDYLDRPEMIDLVDLYEVRYSAQNRWIEPLGAQLYRTLGANLDAMLEPDAILPHPWFAADGVDLQVEVTFGVIRLDTEGRWVGDAEWAVRDASTRAALERSDFDFELGRDSIPPHEIAGAFSAELQRLSTEIAEAVRRQSRDE